MKVWVKKEELMKASKARGLVYRLSAYNVWVPCRLQNPENVDASTQKVTVHVPERSTGDFEVKVPIDHVMFSHSKYLRHSLPLRALPQYREIMSMVGIKLHLGDCPTHGAGSNGVES